MSGWAHDTRISGALLGIPDKHHPHTRLEAPKATTTSAVPRYGCMNANPRWAKTPEGSASLDPVVAIKDTRRFGPFHSATTLQRRVPFFSSLFAFPLHPWEEACSPGCRPPKNPTKARSYIGTDPVTVSLLHATLDAPPKGLLGSGHRRSTAAAASRLRLVGFAPFSRVVSRESTQWLPRASTDSYKGGPSGYGSCCSTASTAHTCILVSLRFLW